MNNYYLYKEYKETIRKPFYLRKIVQLEMDIYSELLQKRYERLQGTVYDIAHRYFYGAPTQVVYAFLFNLEPVLKLNIKNVRDIDELDIKIDLNAIYDYLKQNGYDYLINLYGWHRKDNRSVLTGKIDSFYNSVSENAFLKAHTQEPIIISKFSDLEELINKYENGVLLTPIISEEEKGIFIKKRKDGYAVIEDTIKLLMDYDELQSFYVDEVKKITYSAKEYVGSFIDDGRALNIKISASLNAYELVNSNSQNFFESKLSFMLSKELGDYFTNIELAVAISEEEFFKAYGENLPLKNFLGNLKTLLPEELGKFEKEYSGNQVLEYELLLAIDVANLRAVLLEIF
ncbi:MAG: hypothetical protein FWF50_04615 [Defluviitaleaceae bacterium]|nr:hypothetical protein [Defluviitaleaceae bacterium]